jgi:hypothetical protein
MVCQKTIVYFRTESSLDNINVFGLINCGYLWVQCSVVLVLHMVGLVGLGIE